MAVSTLAINLKFIKEVLFILEMKNFPIYAYMDFCLGWERGINNHNDCKNTL